MSFPRNIKQSFYFGVYILIFGLIIYWASSLFIEPSILPSATPPQVSPLVIENSYLLPVEAGDFDAMVVIKNPNFDYGASELILELYGRDSSGKTSILSHVRSFILPAQRKNIIVSPLQVNGELLSIDAKIISVSWTKLSQYVSTESLFFVRQQNHNYKDGTLFLEATVANISNFDFNSVWIAVRLDDLNGNPVAVGLRREDTFLSRSERGAIFSWNQFIPDGIRPVIEVYTNVFMNDNFIREKGGGEPFQQLF